MRTALKYGVARNRALEWLPDHSRWAGGTVP